MNPEFNPGNGTLAEALSSAGQSEGLRNAILEALRLAEEQADNPALFHEKIRRPLVLSLLREVKNHRIVLEGGLVFEVGLESRIEQALIMSQAAHPDHVWEPQTTRLLTLLAEGAAHVIVGGAYIGDQVLPLARAANKRAPAGIIHAFEPDESAHYRLNHNLQINQITNVVTHRRGLWDRSDIPLKITGRSPLASSVPAQSTEESSGQVFQSITIDDYIRDRRLPSLDLVMLDTEGSEERALRGAGELLSRPSGHAPNLVFEIHRDFVDWSDGLENTPVVRFLTSLGYQVFAIRDFHDNYPMAHHPIEIIPVDRVYLEGPPHGFNVMATKDGQLAARLDLRMVENVGPKLLLHKNPALHHPLSLIADEKPRR